MPARTKGKLLGLRVDVDTRVGMRDGVPRLLDVLRSAGARATFYFSMGPDRSGLALLNLLRPGFFRKMRRTSAVSVYGLRTVLSGTLLPARPIATDFPGFALQTREEGHETGVHAWEHRLWQDRVLAWPAERVRHDLDCGRRAYQQVFGEDPCSFAAPAWLTCDSALEHQDGYGLDFASDCRGKEPFYPIVAGQRLRTPQVPASLPTLDEALGATHSDAAGFFAAVSEQIAAEEHPVLTVHTEIEGGRYASDFLDFLNAVRANGVVGVPLGELLAARLSEGELPARPMLHGSIPHRHGVLSIQG